MTTLDRYIARQFLVNVVVLLTILFLFVIAIDVAINLGRFAEAGASLSASDDPGVLGRAWLTAYAVCDLWWPRLVQLYGFLLGLVMVAALGFTATQLARSRELLAMVAAGQSLHRVARPVLIVAGGLTLLQAGAQELVLPRVAPLLSRDHGDAGKRFGSAAPIPLVATDDGVLLSAAAFDAELGVLERPFFFEVDERGRSTQVVRAERATWSEPDGAWVLENGYAESRLAAGTAGDRPAPVAKNRVQTSLDPARLRFERDAAYRQ
ncbi:MAG: LptF/LptG family permease, partial [Planctomycetota bacterium]